MAKQPKKVTVNISDIAIDENNRRVLDSIDKIVRWIIHEMRERKTEAIKKNWHYKPEINLSNCVLATNNETGVVYWLDVITACKGTELAEYLESDSDDHHSATRLVKCRFSCTNSIFSYAHFGKTTFLESVEFDGTYFNTAASFHGCNFTKFASFENAIFDYKADFTGSTFDYVCFNNAHFSVKGTNFTGCSFEEMGSFNNVKFSDIDESNCRHIIAFGNCRFLGRASFENIIFTEETNFDGATFEYVNFSNCVFLHRLRFRNTIVNGQLIFHKQDDSSTENNNSMSNVDFSAANIIGRLEFIEIKIADFSGTHISLGKDGVLRFGESNIKNLNLRYLINKGVVLLQNNLSNIQQIDLSSAVNFGVIEVESTQVNSKNRRTARLLKDSAYKSNNSIDAVYFKSKEMKLYWKELSFEIFKKREVDKTPDLLLLIFNTVSNNNGQSWWRGVLFTCFTAWVFFVIINYWGLGEFRFFEWGWSSWVSFGDVWKNYLKILNLIDFKGEFYGVKLNAFGETLLFLSKIFVGYGIYQTISAFRKYGK